MSTLNLALQTVALERQKMTDDQEKHMKSANSMADIRKLADEQPNVGEAVKASVVPCIHKLVDLFQVDIHVYWNY